KIEIALLGVEAKNAETVDAVLLIEKGLSCSGSGYKTTEEIRKLIYIPARASLMVTNVDAAHDGSEGRVQVFTTQALVEDGLAAHFRMREMTDDTSWMNIQVTA